MNAEQLKELEEIRRRCHVHQVMDFGRGDVLTLLQIIADQQAVSDA